MKAGDLGAAMSMAAYLFVVCLPAAMVFWVVLFRAFGRPTDLAVMPQEFQAVCRLVLPKGPESPAIHPIGPIVMLALINLAVPFALAGQYGFVIAAEAVALLVVQTLWVRRFWVRSR